MSSYTDIGKFFVYYYASLSELYKTQISPINKNIKDLDKFWLYMERIFRNHDIKSFNKKVVSYINKTLTK